MNNEESRLIDTLGGATAVANLCGVRSQAVSYWKRSGIPPIRLIQIAALRPDILPLQDAVAKYKARYEGG